MFERTLEAQALDAPHAKLSPFSIALLVHLTVFAVIFLVSLVMVPKIIEPQPPEHLIITVFREPLEYVPERPAPPAPPAPLRGSESPAPAVQPQPEPPRPLEAPTETPSNLPAPMEHPTGDLGDGDEHGPKGDPNGRPDGVPDGTGTAPGPGGPGVGDGGPVELTPEMVRPVLLHKVQPDYPPIARKARLEGRVTVQAVIGLDGSVESVEIMRSTNPLFDASALEAVRQWTYRPATMGGHPVRVYFVVEVGFVLR